MLLNLKEKIVLEKICHQFELRFLVLFGSQATGNIHSESDLDIAIYPENGFERDEAELERALVKLFSHPEIDLINLKKAGPLLQKEVALNGKVLYAKDEDSFLAFQSYAMRAYYDFSPYLKLREKLITERINNLSL